MKFVCAKCGRINDLYLLKLHFTHLHWRVGGQALISNTVIRKFCFLLPSVCFTEEKGNKVVTEMQVRTIYPCICETT